MWACVDSAWDSEVLFLVCLSFFCIWGEYELRRILALDSDKTLLSPCGACKELMIHHGLKNTAK
ncbi:hypothetical protein DMB92_05985 [Campylobacter sp. MIT 99-7217]|uniref:hypothetical protein n=1 Tax=Campylobacter sp. MIT 99-7217 TaxID=535091 RepID=UPI001158CEAD|nr:hypothetical protein [Campylobacter sp. MIT 99-7217]TQR31927.1 hypothetical protein DMB92_05985 [Campylobacter sp. MIT 99-7217]